MSRRVFINGEGVKLIAVNWGDISSFDMYDNFKHTNYYALTAAAEKIVQDTEEYVPKKTGALRRSAKVVENKKGDNRFVIEYSRRIKLGKFGPTVEAASDLYQGVNPSTGGFIVNWTTSGTGPFWFEEARGEHIYDWVETFGKKFAREFINYGKK